MTEHIIINGKIHTIFVIVPEIRMENPKDFRKEEKEKRSYNYRAMARHNYRKK